MTDGLLEQDLQLIDQIYEAAVLPEYWPSVLAGLGGVLECPHGLLFAVEDNGVSFADWIGTPSVVERMPRFLREGWMLRNEQARRGTMLGEPRFVTDHDLFTPDELESVPFYKDFLRPEGMAWGAGTSITGPTNNAIVISLNRPFEAGPVSIERVHRLNQLRPHIARSAFLTARMRLEKARAVVQTLEALGLPAAGLSRSGRLQVANDGFQALLPDVAMDWRERLKLACPSADQILESWLLRQAQTHAGPRLGHSFPVPAYQNQPPLVIHLIPMSGASQDIFTTTAWLLVAIPITNSAGADVKILEGLFDLTTAEARVVKQLLTGRSIEEIAQESDLSPHTIRAHLKRIFVKTGTNRQAELVSLLAGV